jgi:hypothetical protein
MWHIPTQDLIVALNNKFENTFDIKIAALKRKKINTAMKTSSIYLRNR